MNLNNRLAIAILLLLTLSACSKTYRNLLIETSHPSAQMLPKHIKSLTLIDRASTADFTSYEEQQMQQYFFDNNFQVSTVVLDSLAADTTLKALGQLLYDSEIYDVVIPQERYYAHQNKYYEMPAPMNWDTVAQICFDYQTDAVLALERYYNKIFTDYTLYEGNFGVATINSAYQVVANIYDPSKQEISQQVVIADTIVWQEGGASAEEVFANLPSIHASVKQTAIQAALDIDARIAPQWRQENRIFFLLDKEDADGSHVISLATHQDWDKLYAYWLNLEKSKAKSVQSKAQFNLALACEMQGNIAEAIGWVEKSLNTKYMQQSRNYLNILLKRKSEQ